MAKGKPDKSIDFFISYATPDEAMAREIGAILDEAGYTYIAQFRDFIVGKNFVREMQRGLAASSRLIALLSPAYERSDNCQSEWSAAYAQDPGSRNGKIIPLKIAEVDLNPLAGQIVYKSLVGLNPAERRPAVLEAIGPWTKGRRGARTSTGRASALTGVEANPPELSGAKLGNLPVSIGHLFKGRAEFLRQLRESFRHKAAAAITGKAVHGLGGVGKTRAAIEYGHAYAADYVATFFLIGKSESDLKDSLAALAGVAVLDLPEKNLPDLDARLAAVIRWLRTNPGWLLITDNVDDKSAAEAVRRLLDQVGGGGGHVLITSRVGDWGHVVEPLELDLLTVDAAMDLLRESTPRRTKRADEDAALTRLADVQLGCLSLALVQAAAYIDERRIGFADYSKLFEKEAKKLLAKLGDAAVRNLGYPLPVALTWQASIAQLSDAGRLLLDMLSWLSIEPIPRNLFGVWPDESVDLEEGLTELTRYTLVHWEAENSAITFHRLVAQVTRDNQDEESRDRTLSALFPWLDAVNPKAEAADVRCWPQFMPLLPHVLQLFERTRDLGPYPSQTDLYDGYAGLLLASARYSEAEPLYRCALAIDEAQHGSDHNRVAVRLNNLATLLQDTNRLAEAEPLLRRALANGEVSFGPDHPTVATRLNNLGELLRTTGRDAEAEPLYRRALAIDEANLGPNHWKVANRLNNLALLLYNTGRVVEAEQLYGRALSIIEESHGADHPYAAICLGNLSGLFIATNRIADAEPLLRRALAIDEENFGIDHPTVAIDLNNLAGLLQDVGRLAEAEPLNHRAALTLLRSSKGSGYLLPGTVSVLRNYASALIDAGRKPNDARAAIASVMAEVGFNPDELWPQIFGEES
jgi:tetratricopeptide (TPR) repeat protein